VASTLAARPDRRPRQMVCSPYSTRSSRARSGRSPAWAGRWTMTRCSSAMSPTRTRMTPRGPHRRAAELERRPGHGSRARPLRDPAPTGVPVAVGRTACATTGEREAPLRSRLARTRRPRVAAACRPGPRHRPHGRGGRDGRALGRRRRALQVLLTDVPVQVVARSEQRATGHALHRHRWLLSQHRAPRRLHAAPAEAAAQQQDRSARRL
jgi:hypothetical protein